MLGSFDQETQRLQAMLTTAEGDVDDDLKSPDVSDDAKSIASAIREAGLRIALELRERRD